MKLFDNEIKSETVDFEEYKKLREDIERYNRYYYDEDRPLISDKEYDDLIKKLQKIEEKNPELKNIYTVFSKDNSDISDIEENPEITPTEKIGGTASEKFSKVVHSVPMLSLSNTYNISEIEDFDQRARKITGLDKKLEYILELKLDGLSISLIYEKGMFKQAITRGDGQIGEDVTENVREISSVPKKLKDSIDVEVRGEIVLPISNFNKVNEIREEAGEDVFANPRNAAAGTIRQLDSSIVKDRGLDCYLYYLVNPERYEIKTHLESMEFIKKLGFKTTDIFEKYTDFKELEKSIEKWHDEREKLDYETDGLVIKVNDCSY